MSTTTANRRGRAAIKARPRGARVAPPGESRRQVLDWLQAHGGEFVDPSGLATPKLLEAVGYQGGITGFGALMTKMDRSGEIVRDLTGRRCSRIALPSTPRKARVAEATTTVPFATASPTVNGHQDRDYTAIALTLLNSVVDIVSAGQAPTTVDSGELEACRAETARLQLALAEKDAEIARLGAEIARLRAERNATLDRFKSIRTSRTSVDVQAISRISAD